MQQVIPINFSSLVYKIYASSLYRTPRNAHAFSFPKNYEIAYNLPFLLFLFTLGIKFARLASLLS
jgi:hypothetical protein